MSINIIFYHYFIKLYIYISFLLFVFYHLKQNSRLTIISYYGSKR